MDTGRGQPIPQKEENIFKTCKSNLSQTGLDCLKTTRYPSNRNIEGKIL